MSIDLEVPRLEPGHSVPLLEVDDLRTVFHTSRGDVRAVDGVSLRLEPGKTLGVVGESGSGKSVLARTIMNLITTGPGVTVSGTVKFEGRSLGELSRNERRHFWGTQVAMAFQDPMTSLNPVKKVGTHISESLRFHLGLGKTEARGRTVELLRRVGIPEPERRLDQYPHELSGGMRQRVVIAMALACEPKLLIADEPTTALDVTVQKQILDLLARLAEELDMATILISHDLGVVAGRTDHVAVMYGGRVVETVDRTSELFAHPRHPYTEALLGSIPRLDSPSHTRLRAISGRPPVLIDPPEGCRFAPRCAYAQPGCLESYPALSSMDGDESHVVACHTPVDTPQAAEAAANNRRAGRTAAGLDLSPAGVS